jgi:hypothetical protein
LPAQDRTDERDHGESDLLQFCFPGFHLVVRK